MINSTYPCYHNNMLWRKKVSQILKKKPNSLPFCVYFEYSPIRRIPQNESLMKKKCSPSFIYIYLERYPRLSKVPKISRRLYTAGQTDHSFPTAGNVIKSNKKESISFKKELYRLDRKHEN